MKMKKIGAIAMATLLTSTMISVPAFASGSSKEAIENQEEYSSIFLQGKGVIENLSKRDAKQMLIVKGEPEQETHLYISPTTPIFDQSTGDFVEASQLKKGQSLHFYYDRTKPMILIYPPQISPDFIVVNSETEIGEVYVGQFDKNNVSVDHALQLNVDEQTIVENQYGKPVSLDQHRKNEWIVFYSVTTKSLPPQTSPAKVVVFEPMEELVREMNELIRKDFEVKNETPMIPLRKVAELLGYRVEAVQGTTNAIVSKGNLSYTITRGQTTYGYNRSIAQFEEAPFLIEGKTYVPQSFVKQLLQHQ